MKRIIILYLLLFLSVPSWGSGGARYALVIGNADYSGVNPLGNTLNDARDMAAKLEALGFRVTKVENATRRKLGGAVSDFLNRIRGTDAPALFYYAGHGIQVDGLNYLIPVDAELENELDVRFSSIALNDVLDGMGGRGDEAVNLVILDACRNNPFRTSRNRAIGGRGLAQVSAPSGTLILYATKPGDTASDNADERNGLFTKHLLEAMDQVGVDVENTFKQVAKNVYQASDRRQSPWFEGVLYGRFYFLPPGTGAAALSPPPLSRPQLVDSDGLAWQAAVQCGRPECYRAYLEGHPKGRFLAMARVVLAPDEPPATKTTVKPESANETQARGWIGIAIQDLTPELAASFGMNRRSGVLTAQVMPDGPADEAGLKPGDVILSFNGTDVSAAAELAQMVRASRVGRPAKLLVMSNGAELERTIVPGAPPIDEPGAKPTIPDRSRVATGNARTGAKASRYGMAVVALDAARRSELGINGVEAGVLVERVGPGRAQDAGIQEGDIILKLNQDWVMSVERFSELLPEAPGQHISNFMDEFMGRSSKPQGERSVAVLVQRGRGQVFIALRVPK